MKPPSLVRDVYRDLRDRRLLPLVIVLLVAIPVVPVLLGDSSEPPPPPAQDSALSAEEIPTLPAVLASNPGLRDYRKRLDGLRRKDPFAAHFAAGTAASKAAVVAKVAAIAEAINSATSASGVASGGGTTTAGTTGTSTAIPDASSTTGTAGAQVSTSGGSSSGGGSSSTGTTSTSQWFTYRIDVVTGRAGDTERRRNVKRLTVLPSQSNPVALFLGATEGGKRASFSVSVDVIRSHGDGTCVPSPADCGLVNMRPGDERKFEYAPEGEEPDTYVIHLKDIRIVEIDKPSATGETEPKTGRRDLRAFLGL